MSLASPQSEPTVSVPGKSAIGAHSFCLGQVRNRSPQFLSRYSKLLLRSNNFEFADVASSSLLLCAVAVSFWGLELWTLTSATSSKNAVWSEGNVSGCEPFKSYTVVFLSFVLASLLYIMNCSYCIHFISISCTLFVLNCTCKVYFKGTVQQDFS